MPKYEQLNYLILRDSFLAGVARCSLFSEENFLQVDLGTFVGSECVKPSQYRFAVLLSDERCWLDRLPRIRVNSHAGRHSATDIAVQ